MYTDSLHKPQGIDIYRRNVWHIIIRIPYRHWEFGDYSLWTIKNCKNQLLKYLMLFLFYDICRKWSFLHGKHLIRIPASWISWTLLIINAQRKNSWRSCKVVHLTVLCNAYSAPPRSLPVDINQTRQFQLSSKWNPISFIISDPANGISENTRWRC